MTRLFLLLLMLIPGCSTPAPVSDAAASEAAARGAGQEADAPWLGNEVMAAANRDGTVQVRAVTVPAEIPFNRPFRVRLELMDAAGHPLEGATVALDAWMPGHGHGMNRFPTVEDLGAGRYEAAGMLFHMRGHWELYVDVVHAALGSRVVFEVDL